MAITSKKQISVSKLNLTHCDEKTIEFCIEFTVTVNKVSYLFNINEKREIEPINAIPFELDDKLTDSPTTYNGNYFTIEDQIYALLIKKQLAEGLFEARYAYESAEFKKAMKEFNLKNN